jgi:hypothetical protein
MGSSGTRQNRHLLYHTIKETQIEAREKLFPKSGISTLVIVSLRYIDLFTRILLTICVVISVQHWLLAKILLAIFDPKLPRIGGNRTVAVKTMEVCFSPRIIGCLLTCDSLKLKGVFENYVALDYQIWRPLQGYSPRQWELQFVSTYDGLPVLYLS